MTDPRGTLAVRSSGFYAAKAAVTRARSVAWQVRGTRGSRAAGRGVRILFYHRISDDRDELAVPRRRFDDQLALLADEGYRGVSVEDAMRLVDAGEPVERVVALSFDDGYRDVYEHAVPELERHGFRATVFVAPGIVDGSARLAWYERQPPVLDWDLITELDGAGTLVFGAHTITHPNLLLLDDADAAFEIRESKRELESRLHHEVETFCYPAGLFGKREEQLAADAGFRWATSCEPGANTRETNRLALRRVQIDRRDRLIDFRAKLAGGHDRPLALRNAYRRARYGRR